MAQLHQRDIRRKMITIICLATSECNLQCKYCYTLASHSKRSTIPLDAVTGLVRNCSQGFDSVEFCWHGGEPLLLGRAFYQAVFAAQQQIRNERNGTVDFLNTLQSNCILLSDELLEFFVANNVRLGSTFEAPPEVHLAHRPGRGGVRSSLTSYLDVFAKIRAAGLPLGLLCVITKSNVNRGREIFEFFRSLGAQSYSLLPLITVSSAEGPHPPTNRELFALYAETFDLWMGEENSFTCIEPLNTMLRSLCGQRPRQCSFASSCLKRMITVAPDGTVYPCGSLTRFPLGNVFSAPLLQILHNDRTTELRRLRSKSTSKFCGDCDYVSMCRGGCREIAYWNSGGYEREFAYCEARKLTFAYLESRTRDMLAANRKSARHQECVAS